MLGDDKASLASLMSLTLDHSLGWVARLSAAVLLSRVICAGGRGAEAAVGCGAFVALLELMDRDTFPFYRYGFAGVWECCTSVNMKAKTVTITSSTGVDH